jgi:hypothetical protein
MSKEGIINACGSSISSSSLFDGAFAFGPVRVLRRIVPQDFIEPWPAQRTGARQTFETKRWT